MTLARLLRMSPDELRVRAQQAISKRWAKPPACRLIPASAVTPQFPDLPPLDSPAQAEKIRQHRFDLLGYLDLDFGTPIDWHYDPVHHKHAPRKPWHQIPFLDFNQVGDHKIIWELNRHQHLVTLAQAGFRDEILAQWAHWQTENPYPIGINWASALEVAFRALSWLWVRHLIGDFHPDLLPALHLHAWHIEQYLSTYFSPNTHLLGEAVALFAVGTMCPQIAEAARWQTKGWQILLEQAEKQIRPDGFHFEQSVYYHLYARDFFAFARALSTKTDLDQTLEKMDAAISILSQSGRLPNFGDDDGGRLLVPPRPHVSASPHLAPGGIYSLSGLYINAGPHGAGHAHADALSIQLILDGRPILIDPGTYCYVCPERDRFRGTAAHNTLQIDGRDQAQPAGPFAWKNPPQVTVDRWYTSDTFDFFAGHHNGYAPVIHHRQIFSLKDEFWLVRDVGQAGSLRTDCQSVLFDLAIHWHYLNPRDLHILPPHNHTWTESKDRWDWSPIYGRKEPAYVLTFTTQTQLPAELAVILTPGPPGTFTQTAPGSYTYKQPQGSHEFIFTQDHFTYRAITPGGVTEHTL